MATPQEQFEKQQRAARLKVARTNANLGGYRKLASRFGWNENTFKAHEQGKSSFGLADARKYAKAFNVSVDWLFIGTGAPEDQDQQIASITDVPLVSWVSAGAMGEQDAVINLDDFRTIPIADLPEGTWIALRVDGPSMNKISPPESTIVVNLRDRRLVANACYIVADESGNTTYKRYRPSETPPFQPASYEDIPPPQFKGAVNVIGRVRRSIIDM